jgi:hypothetical protein
MFSMPGVLYTCWFFGQWTVPRRTGMIGSGISDSVGEPPRRLGTEFFGSERPIKIDTPFLPLKAETGFYNF